MSRAMTKFGGEKVGDVRTWSGVQQAEPSNHA